MKKAQITILLLAVLLLFGTVSAQYDFESLNFNGGCTDPAFGICSFGRGINDSRTVVGWGSSGVLGAPGSEVGFALDRSGAVIIIEVPGAIKTRASGNNDRGDIVGQYTLPSSHDGDTGAFLRRKDGTYRDISFPGSTASLAWGINNRGQAVGEYVDSGNAQHAYVSNPNGTFQSFDFPAGMLPTGTTLRYTRFRDINDHGEIVGYYGVVGGVYTNLELHGFLLDQKGRITPIDYPVGPRTDEVRYANLVHGITNSGVITGGYYFGPANTPEHGFVRNKKGVFSTVDFPGAALTEIYKSSESGVLVGGARGFDGISNAFVASPSHPIRSEPVETKTAVNVLKLEIPAGLPSKKP